MKRVVATVLLTFAVVSTGIVGFATPAAANHRDSPTQSNLTVIPDTAADRKPGASSATWLILASEFAIPSGGFQYLNYTMTTSGVRHESALSWANCSPTDASAYGIDRGNDDPGTKADVGLVSKTEGTGNRETMVYGQFYEPSDFAGQTVYLNESDQIVVKLDGCIQVTDEPGWYQFGGLLNGTTWGGQFAEGINTSHYVAICDCEDREAAKQQLGPPPSQEGSQATETPTPTATATATPTPTPAPTRTEREAEQSTATPTRTQNPDQSTGTATRTATERPAETATADESGTPAAAESVPTTPTLANGPGFGAALSVVALLGAALLAVRRE